MPSSYNTTPTSTTNLSINRQPDVRQQYQHVMQMKRRLEIQTSHDEKLKRLTKCPKEIERLNDKINTARINFLNYGVNNF
ncbi:hypothetical protein [Ectropis obliqua nucleopolyhedrovirus]|uniref:Uncharacterized protein n=1 Tax=Ectropis obliqua nucleopolyhedrovirus TaxID=59376 RepID=A0EYS0_9ABAC|nr:hypothetical protein EONV_gp017 [Ectropis obliqua nucleopolyhedrovirus]ABI35701.1 hypothetical protein [Ectropis obliqua nucleopolyhedrovirus]QWV59603.1 hypothetical protein EONV_gp017 [Ectropis obliqua nucleopolyhedrovirus]UYO72809.1 hypothetical protein EONV-gp017 [Ectropis obliqua nucleopolyhedrovirus]